MVIINKLEYNKADIFPNDVVHPFMKLKYTTNQINRFLIVAVILLLIIIAFLLGKSPYLFQPISMVRPSSSLMPSITPLTTPTITTEPSITPATTISKENNKTDNCSNFKEDLFRTSAKQSGYSSSEIEEFITTLKAAGCPKISSSNNSVPDNSDLQRQLNDIKFKQQQIEFWTQMCGIKGPNGYGGCN